MSYQRNSHGCFNTWQNMMVAEKVSSMENIEIRSPPVAKRLFRWTIIVC